MEIISKILSKEITDKYDIVSNSFIGKDKGKPAEERQVEIGDIHSDDFQPQVKLKQWSNETNFSVRLIDDEPDTPEIKTEGNKIKFIKNKLEAHFYNTKIEKTNAYEFEILLKEKPKTNKVQMSIETKGLKFYYQPSLKEEHKIGQEGAVEITDTDVKDKDGKVICHRPENVIGSYAVYHESKQGDYSKMGLKNYRAGKAFHIYRPKIIDNAGTEVWGELNITDNLLTVTIPQEFLDNAVYPVRHAAGLRFGYYNDGTPGGSSTTTSNKTNGTKFSATEAGTGTSISFYKDMSGFSATARAALYKADKSFVEETESKSTGSGDGWLSFDFNNSVNLTAQEYAIHGNIGYATVAGKMYYDSGDANQSAHFDALSTGDEWPKPNTWSYDQARKYSIYCTYTAGGATQKEVTDVGSGADAVSILCKTPVTDNGAGVDIASILASMNLTDTGSGADTISITQLKEILETGNGTDLISLINKLSVTDTGAGAEIISLLGKIAVTDTGAGSEALSVLNKLSITDTGAGSEAISVLVEIALTDTGAGSEALDILYKNAITDSGVGSEIVNVLAQIVLQETGTGADVVSKQIQGEDKQVSDSGTGTEAISVLAQIALTDSGAGSEAVSALIKLSVLDSGTGTEIINILSQILQTDSGSGAEALEILRQIAISDSGSASEALTVLVQLAVSETGSGADAVSVGGNIKEITDTGSGNEVINILIGMSITDSGVGTEILDILNQIVLTDTASGADAITVIGQIATSDSGSGSEALEILSQIAISDSGLGAEVLEVLVQVALSDTGTGIEILNILNQLAIADSGSGADEISKTSLDTREITDSGTGADVVAFAKQLIITDNGVGTDSVTKQKIIAAIATILSTLDKNANIKLSNQIKAKIKKIINN